MDVEEDLSRSLSDEINPIKKIVSDYSSYRESNQNPLGPKLENNISFKLQNGIKLQSSRSANPLKSPDSSPERTIEHGVFMNTLANQTQTIGGVPFETSNMGSNKAKSLRIDSILTKNNLITSNRKASLSRFSRRFPGNFRNSIMKRKREKSNLTNLTLQELLFRQKLDRFVRNIRTQCGLSDVARLTREQLMIINDCGAYNNEIMKSNTNRKLQIHRKENMFKKKLENQEKLHFKTRFFNFLKQNYEQQKASFNYWLKSNYLIFEEKVPVLKPFGKFKIIWEIIMLTLTFWNLLSFSLMLSFSISLQESVSLSIPLLNNEKSLLGFQIICVILYYADIIIKFNTSFYSDGEPISDRKRIFKAYVRGGLVFDLLGTYPFWQYLIASEQNDSGINYNLFFLLFKLYPLQVFFKNINEALLNIEGKLEAVYYLAKLLLKVLIFCHIFACVWHFQANQMDDSSTNKNWIIKQELVGAYWTDRYLRALYFTVVTMTTVGYGDISPNNTVEYLVAMACMLFGSGLIGYSINSIGTILKKMNKVELEFRNKMQLLNGYLNKKNIEDTLKIRVRKYLEYIWKIENSENDKKCEQMFRELPNSLREELFTQSRISILKSQSLFRGKFKESTIKRIATEMSQVHFSKEEMIFREGDMGDNSLYIIVKGSVDLLLNQGVNSRAKNIVFKNKKAGECFGLLSFLLDTPRQCCAKAKTVCTLYKLDKNVFLRIVKGDTEDFESYCMIRDKIFLYNDMSVLGIKCESCGELSHTIRFCPFLTFQPFKNIIIKKHLHSEAQERRWVKRGRKRLLRDAPTLNALLLVEEIKKTVNSFQEDRIDFVTIFRNFYSQLTETYNLLPSTFKLAQQADDNRTESKRPEDSKDIYLPSREEIPTLEEELKGAITPSPLSYKFKENLPEAEEEEKFFPKEFPSRNPESTVLLNPPSQTEFPLSPKDIRNGTRLSSNYFSQNQKFSFPEDFNKNVADEEKRATIISRGQRTVAPRHGTLIKGEKLKRSEEGEKEDEHDLMNKSRRTSRTAEKTVKPFIALFEKDFDEGSNFTNYFPDSNKKKVLEKFRGKKKKTLIIKPSKFKMW